MDEAIKKQLEIVRKALQAYDDDELSGFSTLVAIQLVVSTQRTSKDAVDWVKNAIYKQLTK